jgi:RND family efflux transporter MFP subunit
LKQLRQQAVAQPALTKGDIAQAQSSLVSAKKELERLQKTVHPDETAAAIAAKRQADANLINAQADYERQIELEKKGYVAQRAVENAQMTLDVAKANQDSANESLAHIEEQHRLEIGKQEDEIRRLQALLDESLANRIQDEVKRSQYKAAIAALEQARIALRDVDAMEQDRQQSLATVRQLSGVLDESLRELSETQIRAPISGVVTQKPVHEGELITSIGGFSAGTTLVRIEVRDAMRVTLDINEIDVAKLELGMPAEVDVDALPDRKLRGHVSKIAPASTTTGDTTAATTSTTSEPVVKYSVEVLLDDKEPRLKSGMSAKCTMDTLSRKNVLRLPVEFVGKDGGKRFVMLAPNPKDPKAKATRVDVTTGASTGAYIELISGIKEGQKVVKPDYKGPSRKGALQMGPDRDDDSDQSNKK